MNSIIGETLQKRMGTVVRALRRLPKKKLRLKTKDFLGSQIENIKRRDADTLGRLTSAEPELDDGTPAPIDRMPETLGDLVDMVASKAGHVAEVVAADIREAAAALVLPEWRKAVLERKDLSQKWPLPIPRGEGLPAQGWAVWFSLTLLYFPGLIPTKAFGVWQPLEARPSDVLEWAAARLQSNHPKLADEVAAALKKGEAIPWLGWASEGRSDGYSTIISPGALSLLYLAEEITQKVQPQSFDYWLIDTGKSTRRAMTSLVGADPQCFEKHDDIFFNPSDPTSIMFKWGDGQELTLDVYNEATPLLAIAQAYGTAAVRDMLALYAFTWAARASAKEAIWWWPDEHLELTGRKNTKDGRQAVSSWLRNMTQTRLVARYKQGAPLIGPLVTISVAEAVPGGAVSLHLHPALYRGVKEINGRLGTRFWPVTTRLLQLPSDNEHGRVHVLPAVFGPIWHAQRFGQKCDSPLVRIRVETLVNHLAIDQKRRKRGRDARAAETLRRALEMGKDVGLIGDWHLESGGDLENMTGNLLIAPGVEALAIIERGAPPKPAWMPSTGGELKEWIKNTGKTTAKLGGLLGLPESTLRRVTKSHRDRPLPQRVRSALRGYLWG